MTTYLLHNSLSLGKTALACMFSRKNTMVPEFSKGVNKFEDRDIPEIDLIPGRDHAFDLIVNSKASDAPNRLVVEVSAGSVVVTPKVLKQRGPGVDVLRHLVVPHTPADEAGSIRIEFEGETPLHTEGYPASAKERFRIWGPRMVLRWRVQPVWWLSLAVLSAVACGAFILGNPSLPWFIKALGAVLVVGGGVTALRYRLTKGIGV